MYLNLVQLAESFGVAESVVEDWVRKEELPHAIDRGRLLFDRQRVSDWAASRGLTQQVGFLMPPSPVLKDGSELQPLLRRGGIWRDVAPGDVGRVYERVVASLPGVAPALIQLLTQRLRQPGAINAAPVGGGWALPHFATRLALGRETGTVALLLLSAPLPLEEPTPDGLPVRRMVFFIAPSARAHLDLLARFGRALMNGSVREQLERGGSDEDIFRIFEALDAGSGGKVP
jgi:PTS system nitrogen regulatory IIA component